MNNAADLNINSLVILPSNSTFKTFEYKMLFHLKTFTLYGLLLSYSHYTNYQISSRPQDIGHFFYSGSSAS